MHLVEIRVERVHQRDVEPVLPDALRAARLDAVVMPGTVGRGHRLRLRIPRLDLVRYGPQRAECLAFELAVIRFELGRVLDVRAADDVFALHAGDSTARAVMPNSITPAGAAASAGRSSYAEIAALQLAIRAELRRAAGPDNAPFLQHVMPVGDTR